MIAIVLIALGFVILLVVGIVLYNLHAKLARLTAGTNGKDLSDAMIRLIEQNEVVAHRIEELEKTIGRIDAELKSSIRGVSTVRYNAFRDTGGNQSFASAFLSEEGDGVLLTSIYSRDRMNLYAKPIAQFRSEFEMTPEESRALKEAAKIFE